MSNRWNWVITYIQGNDTGNRTQTVHKTKEAAQSHMFELIEKHKLVGMIGHRNTYVSATDTKTDNVAVLHEIDHFGITVNA